MANTHNSLTSLFNDIANQIRAKDGTSAVIKADDFPSKIAAIKTGYEVGAFPLSTSKGVYAAGYIDPTKGGSVSATTWTSSGTRSGTNLTL